MLEIITPKSVFLDYFSLLSVSPATTASLKLLLYFNRNLFTIGELFVINLKEQEYDSRHSFLEYLRRASDYFVNGRTLTGVVLGERDWRIIRLQLVAKLTTFQIPSAASTTTKFDMITHFPKKSAFAIIF